MMSQRVSALIIAPPGRLRDSLRVLLRASGRIGRVEEADDARFALGAIAERPPGLVVLDAGLGEADALELLGQIKTHIFLPNPTWPATLCFAQRPAAVHMKSLDAALRVRHLQT